MTNLIIRHWRDGILPLNTTEPISYSILDMDLRQNEITALVDDPSEDQQFNIILSLDGTLTAYVVEEQGDEWGAAPLTAHIHGPFNLADITEQELLYLVHASS
jgi:hypothetical protein